jgi:hypothetical protein
VPGAAVRKSTLRFFNHWGLDPAQYPGLHLHVQPQAGKSAQAISIMVRIPEEVHILMRPEGGWIDVETLWHELGHGLSAVTTDPSLPVVDRELATAFNLSEAYAFLLQRMALSRPVLESVMGVPEETVATIVYYKDLKDLSVFRRYAAKFISEYEMFSNGDLTDGRPMPRPWPVSPAFTTSPRATCSIWCPSSTAPTTCWDGWGRRS